MEIATRQLVEAIHHSSCRMVVVVTGGGTGAVAALLAVPGGSRTILEAIVPYGEVAMIEFLGHRPAQFCSAEAGQAMAARAFDRACWLASRSTPPMQSAGKILGVACTASLVTDRPKSGDHRCHITVHSAERVAGYSLVFRKGERDREGEEAVVDGLVFNSLAEFLGLQERVNVGLHPGEQLQREELQFSEPLENFLQGRLPSVCVGIDGRVAMDAPRPAVLIPGSFNPAHEGHWRLHSAAERLTGQAAAFELSVTNVDKLPLTGDEIRRRLNRFTWRAFVWLTRAPTFAEKARLFPGVTFVVGADTAARIVSTLYYQDNEIQLAEVLNGLRAQDCRFLVACRYDEEKQKFIGLADLGIPPAFRDLFVAIPETEMQMRISSTDLRAQAANPDG
jgi:hypothetical protein